MIIKDIMTKKVEYLSPQATLQEAASKMKQDFGFIPVGENDRLVGAITDRDIVIRAVAEGKQPDSPIRDFISEHIQYCFEDDGLEKAVEKMKKLQIRRLVVLNDEKRMVGVVSLGDIATQTEDKKLVADVTEKISQH